jgi:hypothetical protein
MLSKKFSLYFGLNNAFLVTYIFVFFLVDICIGNILGISDSFCTIRFAKFGHSEPDPGLAPHFRFRITIAIDNPFCFGNLCSNDDFCGLMKCQFMQRCSACCSQLLSILVEAVLKLKLGSFSWYPDDSTATVFTFRPVRSISKNPKKLNSILNI